MMTEFPKFMEPSAAVKQALRSFEEENKNWPTENGQAFYAADAIALNNVRLFPATWPRSFFVEMINKEKYIQVIVCGALYLFERQRRRDLESYLRSDYRNALWLLNTASMNEASRMLTLAELYLNQHYLERIY